MTTENQFLNSFEPGRLEWIGISTHRRSDITPIQEATFEVGGGILGDHHTERPVTLIQLEHLEIIKKFVPNPVTPELLRRNLVVSGINLHALMDREFTIGETTFRATKICRPCKRMEENLGFGGYNAVKGHGGIVAEVLVSGVARIGDPVTPVLTSLVEQK